MSNKKGYRFDETFKAFSEFVWENPKEGILRNAFNMAGKTLIYDFHAIRVDCYWWTMLMLMENNLPKSKSKTPYWDKWIKDLGFFKEEQTND